MLLSPLSIPNTAAEYFLRSVNKSSVCEPHLACASSKLWSVMVIICCNMSPMSCFLPSPSVPAVPSCICCARPGCPAMPTPWECINRGCSSILDHGPCCLACNFSILMSRAAGRRENILGNSSGFLCVSLRPDTPPFSLVSFSGFGRRETDKPSLGRSPSCFRWNLIWIAAFGFGHSCTATVGKEKNRIEH